MKVFWTSEAVRTFDAIMDYLEKQFSEKQKENFFFECADVVDLIEANPYLSKFMVKNDLHAAVIHKYTTLFFEIDKQSDSINLLSFFDTRQNPDKKTFI